ncbi:hypothetical protein, partial [Roseovarius sp. D0-M9]|uniref:hypothetical protein n=1 Tax=Roseovarius sp. D0-M9 TaxID=3127117 RepID=UPI00300FA967
CRRSAQAPARVTLRHNIWCGRELTGDPHTHTNREEAQDMDPRTAALNFTRRLPERSNKSEV